MSGSLVVRGRRRVSGTLRSSPLFMSTDVRVSTGTRPSPPPPLLLPPLLPNGGLHVEPPGGANGSGAIGLLLSVVTFCSNHAAQRGEQAEQALPLGDLQCASGRGCSMLDAIWFGMADNRVLSATLCAALGLCALLLMQ